jgi:hypothetical protein
VSRPRRVLLSLFAVALIAAVPAGTTAASGAGPQARTAADGSGWTANAVLFRGRNGEQFTFDCPKYGSLASVWGTDQYTDDSSVCTAAVHAGLITLAGGGSVTIEIRPDAGSYTGSTRNRVTSNSYPSYAGSYVFVGGTPTDPGIAPGGTAWGATAAPYRNWVGAQYEFDCPPNGTAYGVWGRDIYTDDSSVCTAAVHGGLITFKKGGKVKIQMRDGLSSYTASKRNGVATHPYQAWPSSFIVVDAPDGPDTPEGVATGNVTVNGQPFTSGPVRYGSTVNVTGGTLKLTAAGVGSLLTFGDGSDLAQFKLNKLTEKVGKKKRVSAELALAGGDFSACTGGGARASGGPAGKVVRALWSQGTGRFKTKGKYASATVRGTNWETADQCDGTLTTVTEGAVLVRDIRLKKNVVVKAGGSYLAKAP